MAAQRRGQAPSQQPLAAAAGQLNANVPNATSEYLIALARQQPRNSQALSASQLPGQAAQQVYGQQAGLAQAALQQGGFAVSGSQVQLPQQHIQYNRSGAMQPATSRPSQSMQAPTVNYANGATPNHMLVDAQGNTNKATADAIIAAAATVGIEITLAQIQGLTTDQVRHILSLAQARSRRMSVGAVSTSHAMPRHPNGTQLGQAQVQSNVAAPAASSAGSVGNSIGQYTGAQGHIARSHQQGLTRAAALEKQQQLQQHLRQQQMQQQYGAQAVASAAQANRNAPASAAITAAPQIRPNFGGREAKMVKQGATPEERRAALAQAMRAANRARAKQAAAANATAHVANAASSAPAVSRGAAVPMSSSLPVQGNPLPANVVEAQFWAKIEDMRRKYRGSLQELFPIIRRIQERQPAPRREAFMKHLGDCFDILNLQRPSPIPPVLSAGMLDKAERFIHQVVSVHSKYLRDMVQNSAVDPAKRSQLVAQLGMSSGAMPSGKQPVPNRQAQQSAYLHQQAALQQRGTNLTSGTVAQMDAQQQQNQLSQRQIPSQMQAQYQQRPQGQAQLAPALPRSQGSFAPVPAGGQAVTPSKVSTSRARLSQSKGPQRPQSSPMSAALSSGIPSAAPVPAPGQTQGQVLMQGYAQVHAAAQSNAAAVHMQAAKALAVAKATSQGAGLKRSASGAQSRGNQRGSRPRKQQGETESTAAQAGVPSGINQEKGAPRLQSATAVKGSAQSSTGADTGTERPKPTLQQQVQHVAATAKDALEQAERLEAYFGKMNKIRIERIQSTVAALRMVSSSGKKERSEAKSGKRKADALAAPADVDNVASSDGLIKSKTVFECSSQAGLRLAKRPKGEGESLSLREVVEADCKAAKDRKALLMTVVTEEFGQPVVTCSLKIPEIRLPKLVLRVEKGYPRRGGCTYGFERPPMGWVGVVDEIRKRFKRALANAPAASFGVASVLDAWAREADAVIYGSWLSSER